MQVKGQKIYQKYEQQNNAILHDSLGIKRVVTIADIFIYPTDVFSVHNHFTLMR